MKSEKKIGLLLGVVTLAIVGILQIVKDSGIEQTVAEINQTVSAENFIESSQIIQNFGIETSSELPIQFDISRVVWNEYKSVFVDNVEYVDMIQNGGINIEISREEDIMGEGGQKTAAIDVKKEVKHTVTSNDNLSNLSRKYYGDVTRWSEIYEANRDIIEDPDNLQVGVNILIPDVSTIVVHEDDPAIYTNDLSHL